MTSRLFIFYPSLYEDSHETLTIDNSPSIKLLPSFVNSTHQVKE